MSMSLIDTSKEENFKADSALLFSVLEEHFNTRLDEGLDFRVLVLEQDTLLKFSDQVFTWMEDLGFKVTEKSAPGHECRLTIPEFVSSRDGKMTTAQEHLKDFRVRLKAQRQKMRANTISLCKVLENLMLSEGLNVEDYKGTIVSLYYKCDGKPYIKCYERVIIDSFFLNYGMIVVSYEDAFSKWTFRCI